MLGQACHLSASPPDLDASYFGFTVGSPPGVPGGGITGIEAVPLSGGARTLRSPIRGGFITPLDWQLESAEFEGVFGRLCGASQGFGAGSACGVCGSCGDATATRLPAATSVAARNPNRMMFMALAFPVHAAVPPKNGFVTRASPAHDQGLPTISGRTIDTSCSIEVPRLTRAIECSPCQLEYREPSRLTSSARYPSI
jgi:hypothetical protein